MRKLTPFAGIARTYTEACRQHCRKATAPCPECFALGLVYVAALEVDASLASLQAVRACWPGGSVQRDGAASARGALTHLRRNLQERRRRISRAGDSIRRVRGR